jgi:hypothetical protein
VTLELRGTHWEVIEPVHDAAEYSRVATLIDAIQRAEVERNLGPTDDAQRFGLHPARAVVTLTASGDTLAHLELGTYTVDGAFVYARRSDGDVVLVPPAILSAANLPAAEYRDQHLVRVDLDYVMAITVRRQSHPTTHWARRAQGEWFTVVDGDTVAGDSVEVPTYLRRFTGMRVRSFVDPGDTARAFSAPAGSVTLHKQAPSPPVTIRFVARPDSSYWARIDRNPRVVDVQGDVPSALDASVAALRDRRLLQFWPPRATRIQVVTPDTSAVLVRAGDTWALPNPALGRLDARATADFIRALRALRYRRVVAGSVREVEPAAFTLVIGAEGDTILDELRARPRPGSDPVWIVTSRSSRTLAELPAQELHALIDHLRRMRTSGR